MSEAARVLFGDSSVDEDPISLEEETPGDDEAGEADVSTEAEEDESPDEESGEEDDSDTAEEAVEEEKPAEAALRFANHQEAERAYAEAQARMNQLQNQLYQQQNLPAPVQAPGAVDYGQAFSQDPLGAFNHAMENDPQIAAQIIARVKMDTAQLMSQAAIANDEGDVEGAQRAQQQAYNAAMLEQQMTETKIRAEYEASLAPTREREFVSDLSDAAARATHGIEGADQHQEAVTQLISANPHLMGDWSPAAMEQGFSVALSHVMRQAPQNIDDVVAAKVAEALAGKKAASKQRAQGGGGGRRGPAAAAAGSDQEEADDMVAGLLAPGTSGMSILFGN